MPGLGKNRVSLHTRRFLPKCRLTGLASPIARRRAEAMTNVIQLLPESVANQIAAGEVVQRPSSIVKELMENAIDAGATQVKLIVRDAGKTLVQVVDDVCGMSETDARM